ncbi:MAG: 50S ribosomal protein L18e [Candidatus Micrarchaeia archaeon]
MMKGPEKIETIRALKSLSKGKGGLFKILSKFLKMPRRKQICVNLSKISRYSKPNSVVVVPGKVLAGGELKHKIDLVALSFSDVASKKIKASGSQIHDFDWLVKRGAKDVILIK